MENTIDINQLSAEQLKELSTKLAKKQKEEAERKKADKKAYKSLQADFLRANIDGLVSRQKDQEVLINKLFADFLPIMELKESVFGVEIKDQESHTITADDGQSSITIGHNFVISFDGTESAGIQIIKDFLSSLPGDDENSRKLSKAVDVLLKPNGKTGMLNPARIIQLNEMRSEFNSDDFNRGVDIIVAAQHKTRTTQYVKGYKFIDDGGMTKKLKFIFTV